MPPCTLPDVHMAQQYSFVLHILCERPQADRGARRAEVLAHRFEDAEDVYEVSVGGSSAQYVMVVMRHVHTATSYCGCPPRIPLVYAEIRAPQAHHPTQLQTDNPPQGPAQRTPAQHQHTSPGVVGQT